MLDISSTTFSKEVTMEYKIKEIREKKRMSQAELAEISGVSRATIIRIESSDNVVINTKTLEKLASALNVSVRTLFLT
jgi:transcriptional regulator with XRE-family HTH domain